MKLANRVLSSLLRKKKRGTFLLSRSTITNREIIWPQISVQHILMKRRRKMTYLKRTSARSRSNARI